MGNIIGLSGLIKASGGSVVKSVKKAAKAVSRAVGGGKSGSKGSRSGLSSRKYSGPKKTRRARRGK